MNNIIEFPVNGKINIKESNNKMVNISIDNFNDVLSELDIKNLIYNATSICKEFTKDE